MDKDKKDTVTAPYGHLGWKEGVLFGDTQSITLAGRLGLGEIRHRGWGNFVMEFTPPLVVRDGPLVAHVTQVDWLRRDTNDPMLVAEFERKGFVGRPHKLVFSVSDDPTVPPLPDSFVRTLELHIAEVFLVLMKDAGAVEV